MGTYLKAFLIATAVMFWMDHLLNRFAPACPNDLLSIGTPDRYLCVVGLPLREVQSR